jgi:competence protein ComEA
MAVTRSAVMVVLAVVLVVVLVGGMRVAWAVRESRPAVIVDGPDRSDRSALEPATPTSAETPVSTVVHVAGQVAQPGIVRLAPGSRVVDAVEAAGGALAEADLAAVNLARPVVDGEQVYVPRPGEAAPAASGAATAAGPADGGGGPVDLNAADTAALDTLPGVGPVLAERIVAWRTEHGRFTTVDELGEVSGIGEKLLGQLRDRVTVSP